MLELFRMLAIIFAVCTPFAILDAVIEMAKEKAAD